MSIKTQYQTLFAYHADTYNKLLDCAENLSETEYKQRIAFTPGSIHDLLFHLLFWLNNWRDGIETNYSSAGLQKENFPSLDALRNGMQMEMTAWQTLLARFEEAELLAERDLGGSQFVLWRILQHLILHGMQHHAEAAAQLTNKGFSPGLIDFIWYTG